MVEHARLLDGVEGRSESVYSDWRKDAGLEVTVIVQHAALDLFRGYGKAIRDELSAAVLVLDAFHVVKLGPSALDEVRRAGYVADVTIGLVLSSS
jgi:transposase